LWPDNADELFQKPLVNLALSAKTCRRFDGRSTGHTSKRDRQASPIFAVEILQEAVAAGLFRFGRRARIGTRAWRSCGAHPEFHSAS